MQTYVCNADFGVYNGDFIIPTDIEGNGNGYMSVEFHYYNPWEYCGTGEYYYWGEPYKQYGDAPQSDEKTIADFFDKLDKEWGAKGLGLVLGEWGVTIHYKNPVAGRMKENMGYYCKVLVSEARKRGFSTFVWDNNRVGNGADHFAIFDRNNNMKIVADWMIKGIKDGVADTQNPK